MYKLHFIQTTHYFSYLQDTSLSLIIERRKNPEKIQKTTLNMKYLVSQRCNLGVYVLALLSSRIFCMGSSTKMLQEQSQGLGLCILCLQCLGPSITTLAFISSWCKPWIPTPWCSFWHRVIVFSVSDPMSSSCSAKVLQMHS